MRDKEKNLLDLESMRLSQDFASMAKTKKLLIHVPVRKPPKHQFFRVHPGDEYSFTAAVVEMDGDDTYLISPQLVPAIPELARPVRLHLYVTRQGAVGLWPVKLPGDDGKSNPWHQSAAEASQIAMNEWIRLVPNMAMGAYDVISAANIPTEPAWPDKSMTELISKAFQGRVVDTEDHPLLNELQGMG